MEIAELSHEQRMALVALVETMAVVDGEVSEEEEQEIGGIAEALGDETYRRLLDEAGRRFPDERRLRAFLPSITDPEARDLIYEKVVEAAQAEPPVGSERAALLEWLARTWDIRVDVQSETEE